MEFTKIIDLKLRDIKSSIISNKIVLNKWDKQEVAYVEPGVYRPIGPKEEISLGDEWSNKGETFLFTREVNLPKNLLGKKIYLELDLGGESAVYINDKLIRGLNEKYMLLSEAAETHYSIKIEATYDIHQSVKHYRLYQKDYPRHYFKTASIIVKNEEINSYYILLKTTLATMRATKNEEHKRVLDKAMELSLNEINFYTSERQEYIDTIKKAKQILIGQLSTIKDTRHPGKLFCVGHSHLDLAFKWPIKETIRKAKRTLATTTSLIDQYDKLYFVQSQPQLYSYVKKYYPELYQRVIKSIEKDQLVPIGGMWIESDTNLTGGESLVRQILYGKKFLEEEFGVKTDVCWLPDCFGFSGALPQILKKSGLNYFLTTKLNWNDVNQFPYNIFNWKGIDGSSVNAYLLPGHYSGDLSPESLLETWDMFKNKDESDEVLALYGYGDGGGGVTTEMMDTFSAIQDIPALPQVTTGNLDDHFKKAFKEEDRLPEWWGELYLETHQGVYTTQAILKKKNRRSEFLYRQAEIFAVMDWLSGGNYLDKEELHDGWELILKNQFHDILPGSCVRSVLDDALEDYEEISKIGNNQCHNAITSIINRVNIEKNKVFLFNSLPWQRTDIVSFEAKEDQFISALEDESGNPVPIQINGNTVSFTASVPALGYSTYRIIDSETNTGMGNTTETIKDDKSNTLEVLENKFYRLEFNKIGELESIYDKQEERELITNGKTGNQLQIFEDKSTYFDTWDINISEDKKYIIDKVEKLVPGQEGPVYKSIIVKKKFNNSTINQEIVLYNNLKRIDFKTNVDWQERQMLLKAAFPLDVMNNAVTYDIAFGNMERAVHNNTSWDKAKQEVPAHKWADLSETGYGVSLLNDCKYGYDFQDGSLRLTLLKGGIFPDPKADIGKHSFTYSLYPHQGDWRQGKTVQEGYKLNQPVQAVVVNKNNKTKDGSPKDVNKNKQLPRSLSFWNLDQENVVIETIKQPETGSGYIIRLYEAHGKRTKVDINCLKEFKQVIECNLMEEPLDKQNVKILDNKTSFSFKIKPYEIKTFRII